MDSATFDNSLRSLVRRTPFRPFAVELVSGTRFEVDHPEATVFRSGVAVYVNPHGVPMIFDHQGVAGFIGPHEDAQAG